MYVSGREFTSSGLETSIYAVAHKALKCLSCGKSFSEVGNSKNTSMQFMKATIVTNVRFVTNHFLKQQT